MIYKIQEVRNFFLSLTYGNPALFTFNFIIDIIPAITLNITQGNTTAEASFGPRIPRQAHPARPSIRLQRVGAAHQRRDHGAPPQQTPPDLREQLERC